jgi:hypothetical protein
MRFPFRRVGLAGAVTAGLAALALALGGGTAAVADDPSPTPIPWDSWSFDFGSASGQHDFVFTNVYRLQLVDKPAPVTHPEVFRIVRDTCTVPVEPGKSCVVTVVYRQPARPVPYTDMLRLDFTDLSGRPVATPGAYLFAGGAEWAGTDYPRGLLVLPRLDIDEQYAFPIHFRLKGINPVDLPPDVFAPWTIVANTCATVPAGAGECTITVGFQPTAAGRFTTPFQMSFTDPATNQTVTAQPLGHDGHRG